MGIFESKMSSLRDIQDRDKKVRKRLTTDEILKKKYNFTQKDIDMVNGIRIHDKLGKLKQKIGITKLDKVLNNSIMDKYLKDYKWGYKDKRKHRLYTKKNDVNML